VIFDFPHEAKEIILSEKEHSYDTDADDSSFVRESELKKPFEYVN